MRFAEFTAPAARHPLLADVAHFGPNPGNLRMQLYVPAGPGPKPLVVTLHGCGQTAEGYAEGAGWLALAQRLDFALLAPEQKPINNPNTCFNWFLQGDARRGMGEAASVRQMIAHALDTHGLDAGRVFVTGLSAGGAMAAALLAAYPDVFAGGAIVAGLPYGGAASVPEALALMRDSSDRPAAAWGEAVRGASDHAGPWPRVAIWHGDADTVVHPANAEASLAQWLDVHGLDVRAARHDVSDRHVTRRWLDASGQPLVEATLVAGLGHGVPIGGDGIGAPAPFILEAALSSSSRIAQFWQLTPVRKPEPRAPRPRPPEAAQPPPEPPSGSPPPEPPPADPSRADSPTFRDVLRRAIAAVWKGH